MKVLVISLLRMGDLILQQAALSRIKMQSPDVELHLLTNRSNQEIAEQLINVDRIHYFEREKIQNALGNAETSIFESADRVIDLVKRMNHIQFDEIYNLTHNRLSGHLAGLIEAKDKFGLLAQSGEVVQVGSAWYRYLNDYSLSGACEQLHLTDVFQNCVSGVQQPIAAEVYSKAKRNPSIAIQPWASESKKSWGDEQLISFIKAIHTYFPSHRLQILHSQENKEKFDFIKKSCNIEVESVSKNFSELKSELLQSCELLVSVDTGVKHFAAHLGVRILEISLGGTQLAKTGVYQQDALILSPKTACYPCPVGTECTQSSFICAEQMPVDDIAAIAFEYVRGQWSNLQLLAEEYAEEMAIHRVQIIDSIGFQAIPLGPVTLSEIFDGVLFKMSILSVLNSADKKDIGQFGTQALQLRKLIARLADRDPKFSTETYFRKVEKEILDTESQIEKCLRLLTEDMKTWVGMGEGSLALSAGTIDEIHQVQKSLRLGHYFSQFIIQPDFYTMRRLMSVLDEIRRVQNTKWKILRAFVSTRELEL